MKLDKKTKTRVDIIAKYIYPVAGGIETNIMQTYTVLADKFGWDVTIHTTADSYLEKNIFPPEETINNLKIRRYPSGWFGFSPSIDWHNADVIALHNFDVFFVRFLFKTYLLKLFGKKKFALIVTPHGGFNPEWSIFKPVAREIKKLYTYTLGAWLINAVADGMRAVSEWEYKEATKYIIPAKVRVIDNGLEDEAYIDVEKFASEEIKRVVKSYGRYVIQIGRVYPIKNYETTIESLQFIPNDVKFVIVGPLQDEAYERQLFELIKKLKLENRVVFTGVCRGIDKYYLMRHAIAMVHMALWESYGNVLREGMSQGLICITSNVYNMPLLVKDGTNGFCLPVYDSKKVAEKISWIIDRKNASRVEQMKKENILLGKDQSWKEVAGKMDGFYRDCIESVNFMYKYSFCFSFWRDTILLIREPKDYLYSFSHSRHNTVKIDLFDPNLRAKAQIILSEIFKKFPELKVNFIGSVALGISGRNDLDFYIECEPKKFNHYKNSLSVIFGEPIKQRATFIEWNCSINDCHLDVLMAEASNRILKDAMVKFKIFQNNPILLCEYELLKKMSNGVSVREYSRRRIAFFNILSQSNS